MAQWGLDPLVLSHHLLPQLQPSPPRPLEPGALSCPSPEHRACAQHIAGLHGLLVHCMF